MGLQPSQHNTELGLRVSGVVTPKRQALNPSPKPTRCGDEANDPSKERAQGVGLGVLQH